jgi:hypothetical protein
LGKAGVLTLEPHLQSIFSVYFGDVFSSPGLAWAGLKPILLISASQATRIIGMSHWHPITKEFLKERMRESREGTKNIHLPQSPLLLKIPWSIRNKVLKDS